MSNVDFGIKINLEGAQQATQQTDALGRNFGVLESVAQRMGAVLGAVAGTALTRGFIQLADSVTVLRNQLALSTGSIQQAEVAYGALLQIAQRSRTSFTELGATFASISRATGELGISQGRLLAVTEAIGNAIAISGGSAAGAQAALMQLSQGFASGTLRGEELNSVMEQTPRLARAIADGLGITIGQLRTMGQDGKLTAQAVLGALESQSRALKGEVASSVATVAQASQVAQNALTALVGEFDRVTGSSTGMASSIIKASQSISDIAAALKSVEGSGREVVSIGAGIAVLFETLTVLGANVAYVFTGIRNEIGGLAAQAVALATGQFAEAANIRAEMVAEAEKARKDVDALTQRVLQARGLREIAEQSLQGVDTRAEDARLARQGQQQKMVAAAVKATAEQLRAAAQEAKKQQSVLNDLMGVTDDYVESLQRLAAMRNANKLSEEQYLAAVDKVIQRQPAVIAAERQRVAQAQEYLGMQELRAEGEREIAEAEQQAQRARADAVAQVAQQVQGLQDEAAAAGLVARLNITHAQAIARVTLARMEDQRIRLVNDPAELAALEQKIALQRQLIQATDEGAAREANTKAAADAATAWQSTANDIRTALTDAFRRSFESGESFGRAFGSVIEREIKARLASALAGLVTDGILQVVGGAAGQQGTQGVNGYMQSAQTLSTLYGWGKAGYGTVAGWFGAGSSAGAYSLAATGGLGASTGSGLYALGAGGTGSGLSVTAGTNAAWGISGSGSGAAASSGSSAAATASSWGPYVAAIVASYLVSANAYRQGFTNENTDNSFIDSGVAGSMGLGGPMYVSRLLDSLGIGSSRNNQIFSGAAGINYLIGRGAPRIDQQGVQGTIGGGGFTGEGFADVLQKGGLFRSDKRWTETGVLDEEIDRFFDSAAQSILEKSKDFGAALGLPVDQLAKVTQTIKVALGDDAAKNEEEITKALSSYGDALVKGYAKAVEPLAIYGETTVETIARVGQSIISVNDVLDVLGLKALQASIEGGKAAVSLEELFGGVATLQQAAGSYLQAFYTDAERTELALRGIGKVLGEVGISTPATRDEFRALVEAQDLTTDAGRRAFTTLMGVADSFAAVTEAGRSAADILAERRDLERELLQLQGNTVAIRAQERAALDESNRALYDQIRALEDQQAASDAAAEAATAAAEAAAEAAAVAAAAAQEIAQAWGNLTADAVQGVADAYAAVEQQIGAERQRVESEAEQAIRAAQSKADEGTRALEQQARQIEQVFGGLAKAISDQAQRLEASLASDGGRQGALDVLRTGAQDLRSGRSVDADALRAAAGEAANIKTDGYASAFDYRRSVAETANLLREVGGSARGRQTAELAAIAAQQLAIEQASEAEIAAIELARDEQLGTLDQQLQAARAAAETLVDIDDGVQTVAGAIEALAQAMGAVSLLQGNGGPTGEILQSGNTQVYGSAGGAVASRQAGASLDDILVRGKSGATASGAVLRQAIAELVAADNWERIVQVALQEGVDSNMVDGIMDWRPGTALAAARLRGLPAFASGSAYVPSTGVALVHEGERILPAADNAALMRLMTGGGGDALATEMRKMREELSFALAAIASHTNRSARILDQFDVDGMPAVRT